MSGPFLPVLDGMMSSGLITIEKVQLLQYGSSKPSARAEFCFSLSIHRDRRCRPRPFWVKS